MNLLYTLDLVYPHKKSICVKKNSSSVIWTVLSDLVCFWKLVAWILLWLVISKFYNTSNEKGYIFRVGYNEIYVTALNHFWIDGKFPLRNSYQPADIQSASYSCRLRREGDYSNLLLEILGMVDGFLKFQIYVVWESISYPLGLYGVVLSPSMKFGVGEIMVVKEY